MRVWAENGMTVVLPMSNFGSARPKSPLARATIERPSGVSSARLEASAAAARSWVETPSTGRSSVAIRLPNVIVPVLSSSSVSTSPAASTARPEVAMTLKRTSRSMPAMPMADRSPPIVVGMRQTSSAISTVADRSVPEYFAIGHRVTQTIRKMMVSPDSRIDSASSFGVFCRSAPSTSAIIRSMKVEPGAEVIFTLMKSDSTVVPPVTAERSPPASRMTGADSPVIADSLTEATPSTMSPSPGMISPASTSTISPSRRSSAFTPSTTPLEVFGIDVALGAGVAARAAQGVGLRLAAPLGDSLGEIREQHREPEPERRSGR